MEVKSKELQLDYVNNNTPFTVYYEIDRFITEVLVDKEYEILLKKSPIFDKKDLVVLDLGCNIGCFSLYIYDKASKVYAVDFSTNCISLLNQTIQYNNFNKITAIQRAIAGTNRTLKVSSLEVTDGGNTIYGDKDEVQAITLATLFKELNLDHIDLLKIDVECAEQEIFNAEDFKDIKDKISVIVGEAHGIDLRQFFETNGFEYTSEKLNFLAVKR